MKSSKCTSTHVGLYTTYPETVTGRLAEGGRRLSGTLRENQNNAPLVSIITVCRNSGATIEQTIRSVLDQNYENIEHIVIDGASTDATLEILSRYAHHLEYYVSEPDKGLYFAMNKGLQLARGEYILILNSDDWYAPTCVDTLIKAKQKFKVDFVSGLANYVDQNGELIRLQESVPFDAGIYFRMPLRHETMLISSHLYNKFGPYDTRYFVNADRALTTKMYEAGVSHFEVKKPLMFFRDTGVSSTDMAKLYGERERMISRHFPGLSAEDVAVLGRLHLMRPKRLVSITRAYDCAKFSKAAYAYAVHRKGGEWDNFDFSELRSMAHSSVALSEQPDRVRNIATIMTADHGGAGIGSQRRVEALRRAGLNAEIYCLFRKSDKAHVDRLLPNLSNASRLSEQELHAAWRKAAVVTREDEPGLSASEMFSKAGTIVDFRDNGAIFSQADIIHLHWVVGAMDYAHLGETVGDKPIAWTLADMNAFTGGCHYSEGCTGYKDECRKCPLLGGTSEIAHETWKAKRDGYAQIKNLHIICPSQWLADRARESSLFRGRPVHMIPNALPIDRFKPTNRIVARQRLGLPLDKRLVAFGADSLNNRRKGGDILCEAMQLLAKRGSAKDVEGLFFGSSSLELNVPTHNVGFVTEEEKLSLVYAAADVFAFPSREDNAPLTVVESMLSGTPVVSFAVGNVPELLEHKVNGYIAAYADAEDFAAGLAWVLNEIDGREALRLGLNSHLLARRHNDPATAVARHVALYESMWKFPAGIDRIPVSKK